MANVRDWIDIAAQFIETLAVLIIVGGILHGIGRYFFYCRQRRGDAYKQLQDKIGKSLLLGLEFLVAADIIRTVALSPTLTNIAVLGVLVLIRTFLSWSLVVEIEGCWPWQRKKEAGSGAREGMGTTLFQDTPGLAGVIGAKTEGRE